MKLTKILVTVFVGICIVAVGLTVALMHDVTEPVVNTFSASKGIALELKEPAWDGYELGTSYPADKTPGSIANPAVDSANLGITKAENYHPGDVIGKNPTVKNTTSEKDLPIYTAIKVEFIVDGNTISKEDFEKNYGTLQFENNKGINTKFTEITTSEEYDLYFYEYILKQNDTATLFDHVAINTDIKVEGSKWPEFQIKVTAYGVQSLNIDAAEAKASLINLAKEVEGGK